MTGDRRPSLEERYGTPEEYLRKFAAAALALVSEGYLLEADAQALIESSAKARGLFPEPRPKPSAQ